jgi:PAS domain S-box-containing protein
MGVVQLWLLRSGATSTLLQAPREGPYTTQAHTQAILNAVPDVILGLDAQCHITLANPGVSSVFGLQPEDLSGTPLADVVPGLTQAEAEQRMTFAMLNLYSRALECTSNGVVIVDMKLPGRPMFYVNPAYARITGYECHEVIGRHNGLLHREDRDQPGLRRLARAWRAGESTQVVLRNYRKDGTLFFNELAIAPVIARDGSVPHYVGVPTDVTERERSRMAIAERSGRLNAVFDLSPDGFVVFDRGGRLVYFNRAFRAMTGWHAQAVGANLDQGIGMSPEQLARVFERFYRTDPSGNIPGTGLGMSLVKEIVELQGGRVKVLSQLDSGTTVTLWLPLAAATAEA